MSSPFVLTSTEDRPESLVKTSRSYDFMTVDFLLELNVRIAADDPSVAPPAYYEYLLS